MNYSQWGEKDGPYEHIDKYEETDIEGKLVARIPPDKTDKMDSDSMLASFSTSNDPPVDIWYRTTAHSLGLHILWRYISLYLILMAPF